MARVSISEAARLTGESRTTLRRLIKTGDLSTCSGERNAKMVDTSELLRVFWSLWCNRRVNTILDRSLNERDAASADLARVNRWFVIWNREIDTWTPYFVQDSAHIDLGPGKQAMLLLRKSPGKINWDPRRHGGNSGKNPGPPSSASSFPSPAIQGVPEPSPKIVRSPERSSPLKPPHPRKM